MSAQIVCIFVAAGFATIGVWHGGGVSHGFSISHGGGYFWVGIIAAALIVWLGRFLENCVKTRLTKRLSDSENDQKVIISIFTTQENFAGAGAYLLVGFLFLIPEQFLNSSGRTGLIALFIVAAANLLTFMMELIWVNKAIKPLPAKDKSDNRNSNVSAKDRKPEHILRRAWRRARGLAALLLDNARQIPDRTWYGIGATGLVWATILVPSPLLITAVAAYSGVAAGSKPVWGPFSVICAFTFLSAFAKFVYAYGNKAASKQIKAAPKQNFDKNIGVYTVIQGVVLVIAVLALNSSGVYILPFYLLLILSRLPLGIAYQMWENFLVESTSGMKSTSGKSDGHEQARSWASSIFYLIQVVVLSTFTWLLIAYPSGSRPSGLGIAACGSTVFVLASGVAWWIIGRAGGGPQDATDSSGGQPEEQR